MPSKAKVAAAPAQLLVVDTCGACHWWRQSSALPSLGTCKRFPPTPLLSAGQASPTTKAEDWCGEFEAARISDEKVAGFAPQTPLVAAGEER